MGFRETMNRNSALMAGVAIVGILVAGYFMFRTVRGDVHIPDSVFYTNDDGKTYYRESIKLDPPQEKDGKEAVIARVFLVDGEKKVGYMERYSPEAAKVIKEFKGRTHNVEGAKGPPADLGKFIGAQQTGRQYKRPGDTKWVSTREREAFERIVKVVNADGTEAKQIEP